MSDLQFVGRRSWPLLFPATYVVHIAEEYWGGEGFYNWIARIGGSGLTAERFLALNAFAWVVMLAACLAATSMPRLKWPVIAFSTVVSLNGSAHLVASVLTATYSPGLFSGTLLWIPLGLTTLCYHYPQTGRTYFVVAVAIGLALHAVVTIAALAP